MKYTCGILAAILLAMLLIKILRYPKLVHADMTGNPILGSVAATFFMTTMQLCVYIKDFAPFLCEAIWLAAARYNNSSISIQSGQFISFLCVR
jgi:exfoliative toxin A/B